MKKSIKAITLALALTLTSAALPVMNCSAYNTNDYITVQRKTTVDFVILAYKNNNGKLTITGCYDYDSSFTVNPFANGNTYGFIAVCVFDGVLEIPSHIDDKPVVDIKSLSGNTTFDTIVVPDAITKILKSAFKGQNYAVETADNELRLTTLYCTDT